MYESTISEILYNYYYFKCIGLVNTANIVNCAHSPNFYTQITFAVT